MLLLQLLFISKQVKYLLRKFSISIISLLLILYIGVNYLQTRIVPHNWHEYEFTKNPIDRLIDNDWKLLNRWTPGLIAVDPNFLNPKWFVFVGRAQESLADQFEYKVYLVQNCNKDMLYDSGETSWDGKTEYLKCVDGKFLTFNVFSWMTAQNSVKKYKGGYGATFSISEDDVKLFKQMETLTRTQKK